MPLRIVANDTPPNDHPEPTDEELWLAGIARRVEGDARPLFTHLWWWLLQQALETNEDEPA